MADSKQDRKIRWTAKGAALVAVALLLEFISEILDIIFSGAPGQYKELAYSILLAAAALSAYYAWQWQKRRDEIWKIAAASLGLRLEKKLLESPKLAGKYRGREVKVEIKNAAGRGEEEFTVICFVCGNPSDIILEIKSKGIGERFQGDLKELNSGNLEIEKKFDIRISDVKAAETIFSPYMLSDLARLSGKIYLFVDHREITLEVEGKIREPYEMKRMLDFVTDVGNRIDMLRAG